MSLPPGFTLHEDWLEHPDRWFETLWATLDWREQSITLFGRQVLQPRLMDWYADPGVRYRYSGLSLDPKPWPGALEALRGRLDDELDRAFNSVLCNAYRDGRDSMGWHADDEAELGSNPVIASVNLGAERRFRIRPRHGGPSVGINLKGGSLLVMSGRSQVDFRHAVPKTRRPVGPRINLTFREVSRPA